MVPRLPGASARCTGPAGLRSSTRTRVRGKPRASCRGRSAGTMGTALRSPGPVPGAPSGAEAAGGGTETDGNVGLEHRAGPVEHVEARPDLPQVMGVDVGRQRHGETCHEGLVKGAG